MLKLTCLFGIIIPFVNLAQSAGKNDSVTCFRITTVMCFGGKDSVYNSHLNDTTLIFLSGKMVMYQRLGDQYYSHYNEQRPDESFEIRTSRNLVYDTSETTGYCFTVLNDIGWMPVDSFKTGIPYENNSRLVYEQFQQIYNCTGPGAYWTDSILLTETFHFPLPEDTTVKCKIMFTYSNKFNDCPLSLAPQMDSLKRMKLCEIRMEVPGFFHKEKKQMSHPFSFITSLNKMPYTEAESAVYRIGLEKYRTAKEKNNVRK